MSDYDYTELSPYVYGKKYSCDVARRMMYGSRQTLELIDSERLSDSHSGTLAEDIDAKLFELRKERQKFFDQRREYNKLAILEGRQEHLYESLKESAQNLNDTVGELFNGNELPLYSSTDSEAVLFFADWHYGLKTENVFNKYNKEICKERVINVVSSVADKLLLHRCSRLHIVVLGDLYHGALHTSARVASEELVCDQIMQVSEILSQAIGVLSKYAEEVVVYMTYGNHGRTVQNKKDSIHRDNIERLIPWWLTERISNMGLNNVKVAEEEQTEFLFVNAAGHNICASHGDLDSVKTSPRLLSTLFQKKLKKDIEYIVLADKHHRESFEELGVVSLICGALCGSDDYANDKRLYATPSQLLLIVNKEDGVDAEYRIKCN